ncbi:hypothetical protein COV13_03675 [Candidatus Woesearchaeota archaeon CG10_big_fil_rev_8_21_14_0_10_32_9]|nr:MAG: hypothetical protein COV13_03675 [Candidatus Woesearchaeota archaeon CG10_big_fil_rev_8_21_14_0_10_32_9]
MAISWFYEYGLVIAFYVAAILLIYFNRSKFEFQGKVVAIYKTKLGIKLMQKIADKFPKTIRVLGIVGIYVGFLGMLLMLGMVFWGLYQLVFQPSAPPIFAPVLPGVSIPGSPVTLPLIEGLIALFVVVVIHEFTHGVLSKAYKIPVKSSGFVMFGPLPGAFVEPDEKKLKKAKAKVQLSIFAGGPFSNVVLSVILFVVLIGATSLAINMYSLDGIKVTGFVNESDVLEGGRLQSLQQGEIIHYVNNVEVKNIYNLSHVLENASPGDSVLLGTNFGNKTIMLGTSPDNSSHAYIGIFLSHHIIGNNAVVDNVVFSSVYFWIFGNPFSLSFNDATGLIGWIFLISIGVGIVNLLPLGPMDGGRMYLIVLEKIFKKKTALKIWANTASFLLFALIALVFVPIIRALI